MKLLGIFVIFWVFVGVNSYGASIKSQIQEIKQWQKQNALYPKDNFFQSLIKHTMKTKVGKKVNSLIVDCF